MLLFCWRERLQCTIPLAKLPGIPQTIFRVGCSLQTLFRLFGTLESKGVPTAALVGFAAAVCARFKLSSALHLLVVWRAAACIRLVCRRSVVLFQTRALSRLIAVLVYYKCCCRARHRYSHAYSTHSSSLAVLQSPPPPSGKFQPRPGRLLTPSASMCAQVGGTLGTAMPPSRSAHTHAVCLTRRCCKSHHTTHSAAVSFRAVLPVHTPHQHHHYQLIPNTQVLLMDAHAARRRLQRQLHLEIEIDWRAQASQQLASPHHHKCLFAAGHTARPPPSAPTSSKALLQITTTATTPWHVCKQLQPAPSGNSDLSAPPRHRPYGSLHHHPMRASQPPTPFINPTGHTTGRASVTCFFCASRGPR